MLRDPMATCLSIYQQPLEMSMAQYACDLEECAKQYVEHHRLMKHWEQVLYKQILVVEYEKLVTDFDKQVRRVLDHVGLSWEPQLKEFHKTEASISTASVAQVRQPLNT